ncbi:MAG: hypothetical protein ACLQD8_08885 [Thermoplasmata archaeon]
MAASLGATQGAVSKVLARLQAVGVVGRERRHVQGKDRRVRVYSLTPKGEELAKAIRDRFRLPDLPRYRA